MTTSLSAKISREYGTPAVVIDMDRVEANIARIQAQCDAAGVANRPHIKTHKSPELAKLQVAAGAKGITCQKIGEAEVMAAAGIDDILISYNLLGEEKMARLGKLLETTKMTVAADNPVVIGDLPKAASAGGAAARGRHRVRHGPQARRRRDAERGDRARQARRRLPRPRLQGLHDVPDRGRLAGGTEVPRCGARRHPPRGARRGDRLDRRLAEHEACRQARGRHEHRPGTYIYNDRMQVAAGVATLDDCALSVYTTVVSRAGPDRGILDAGSKTLTADPGGGLDGFGLILEHPEARIARFAEEHGMLDLTKCNERPKVGDVVRVVPNHVCVVVNMVDEVVMVRGDEIVGILPVAARGRLR